ncbi:MAG TPA: Ada metal-binding domain-containing protein [Holophagaceae bacterium]|nr:Ada metal-binding domain-containing protein [Holophagaceae bacterium]
MSWFRSLAFAAALPACLAAQAPAPKAPAPAAPKEAPAPAKHHARRTKAKSFVGCTQTKVFHKPDCKVVADIEKAGTKVTFSRREEAVQAGYKPCEECKP